MPTEAWPVPGPPHPQFGVRRRSLLPKQRRASIVTRTFARGYLENVGG